jgi:small-conductance mechanosensitive channel
MLHALYMTFHNHAQSWIIGVILVSLAILLSSFLYAMAIRLAGRFHKKTNLSEPNLLRKLKRMEGPARAILLLTALLFVLPAVDLDPNISAILYKTLGVLWFLAFGWMTITMVYVGEDILLTRYDMTTVDNLRARRVRTQMVVLRRLIIGFLVIVDIGLVLSVFHDSRIWQYGAGLLASAGLASLVLATAAKSTAANILAGIQIAISEPIRIDDVVIVEGEWGRIEEITMAYVIIALWDKRRLVVPLSYFIEKPFQNWTRQSSALLGTAFLYVDYSISVESLRQEHTRVLKTTPLWDGVVDSTQVTNLSEKTMEVRCLSSARNASEQFDLRCYVREKMIDFILREYPESFPQTRFSSLPKEQEMELSADRLQRA